MPSPFPGMDPYLEKPELWPDVHARLIPAIAEILTPLLRPRYVARVEQRTFVFDPGDPAEEMYIVPDVHLISKREGGAGPTQTAPSTLAVAERIEVTGKIRPQAVNRYLEIRDSATRQVVTVLEVLSPSNKVESAGRRALIEKRSQVCGSETNWVEVDLLRWGSRSIHVAGVAGSHYMIFVDRWSPNDPEALADRRQFVYRIGLRSPLPNVQIPLRPDEADVSLELQSALELIYDRAAYDMDIDYKREPVPPLTQDDNAWADALLRERHLR